MADFKKDKAAEIVKHLAAQFIKEEAGPSSLLTVTRAHWNDRSNTAIIFFTAYPEDKEEDALSFLKRKRSAFKKYVKNNSRIGRIPFFDFEIDKGEKTRQAIENLPERG